MDPSCRALARWGERGESARQRSTVTGPHERVIDHVVAGNGGQHYATTMTLFSEP